MTTVFEVIGFISSVLGIISFFIDRENSKTININIEHLHLSDDDVTNNANDVVLINENTMHGIILLGSFISLIALELSSIYLTYNEISISSLLNSIFNNNTERMFALFVILLTAIISVVYIYKYRTKNIIVAIKNLLPIFIFIVNLFIYVFYSPNNSSLVPMWPCIIYCMYFCIITIYGFIDKVRYMLYSPYLHIRLKRYLYYLGYLIMLNMPIIFAALNYYN